MNAPALRARSVGEILDLAFQLYRIRWPQLATATGLLVLPLIVLKMVAPLTALPVLGLVGNLFFLAASAAVVLITSEAYMGREIAATDAVRTVGSRFLSVWGAAIIQIILIILGTLLFIIPGILAAIMTFAMQQAVMVEGQTAGAAFERSRTLARDNYMHIVLTSVLASIILIFAGVGFGAVIGFAASDVRTSTLLTDVLMIAINPLTAVVSTVLYYDLRIRREAFDVAMAAERLGDFEQQPVPVL